MISLIIFILKVIEVSTGYGTAPLVSGGKWITSDSSSYFLTKVPLLLKLASMASDELGSIFKNYNKTCRFTGGSYFASLFQSQVCPFAIFIMNHLFAHSHQFRCGSWSREWSFLEPGVNIYIYIYIISLVFNIYTMFQYIWEVNAIICSGHLSLYLF